MDKVFIPLTKRFICLPVSPALAPLRANFEYLLVFSFRSFFSSVFFLLFAAVEI